MNNHDIPGEELYADELTWREQEVLMLLGERLTNREIAERLHLAESTVKDYVGKILSKLYVKNRRQAVERAKALGLLDGDQSTLLSSPISLPAEATPFVGRLDELEEIKQQLSRARLLTLIGPGGIGKTRLALRIAALMADDFKGGSYFASLAPIRSVEDLIQAIAETIKFPLATHENPQYQLLRFLQKKQILLVMDNFEHLLAGAAIVSEILQAAPEVKILATSRERLNLQSETILNVGGMAFPDKEGSKDAQNYDAIALFIQSAGKVLPGFDPSPNDLEQITHICQTVQGMPLAIELAAAWLHILNVDEITGELEKGLDILATEVRDAPQRHRSIETVFDHSWSMLQPAEREIFKRLSVFRGGFTRAAAQQVAEASLGQLASMVNKSFLGHDPDSGRLEVHELLRQYAQERLGKTPQDSLSAQEEHAAYFTAFMGEKWDQLKGERQMQALAEIEADIENVRAAWRYYLDQSNYLQLWNFIKGLWQVYWIRGWYHVGMELFAQAARSPQGKYINEESTTVRALATAFQGFFMAWLDLAEQGFELAEESVSVLSNLNHPEALVLAYDSLAVNAYMLGRYTEEIRAAEEMLKIAAELEDEWLIAFTLFAVSMGALLKKDYTEAKRLAESNLKLSEEIGDVIGSTMPLIVLGHVAMARGDYQQARGFYLRCLKSSEQVGFFYSIQTASKYLGKVNLSIGDIDEAETYLLQCLSLTKEVGFVRDIINLLYEFARLRVAQGSPEQAAEILALVLQHPASYHSRMHEGRIRDSAKVLLTKLEADLPPETYSAALECGRVLELDEVVDDLLS
jgi:predicted ATPase/DNA-binding CsgD family transcriptional regulator